MGNQTIIGNIPAEKMSQYPFGKFFLTVNKAGEIVATEARTPEMLAKANATRKEKAEKRKIARAKREVKLTEVANRKAKRTAEKKLRLDMKHANYNARVEAQKIAKEQKYKADIKALEAKKK